MRDAIAAPHDEITPSGVPRENPNRGSGFRVPIKCWSSEHKAAERALDRRHRSAPGLLLKSRFEKDVIDFMDAALQSPLEKPIFKVQVPAGF